MSEEDSDEELLRRISDADALNRAFMQLYFRYRKLLYDVPPEKRLAAVDELFASVARIYEERNGGTLPGSRV
jgi:ribosomal protein L17